MFKKIFASLVVLVIIFGVFSSLVFAKNDKKIDIPEEEGTYDVPGRPDLKVRIFIHNAKPAKPGKPVPEPSVLQCDLDDFDSLAIVDDTGWWLPSDITYRLNAASVPVSVGGTNLATIASSAFDAWNSEIPGKVNLTQGSNTTINKARLDNNNIIAWGRTSAGALAVTYTWYYTSTGMVAEVDTIMNKSYLWTWSEGASTCAYENSYDAQNILTHEIGHWFGLSDHYTADYADNTMYGYGSKTEVKKNTLTVGDIAGVTGRY